MSINIAMPFRFRAANRLADIGVSEILAITCEAQTRKRAEKPVIILKTDEPGSDASESIKCVAAKFHSAPANKDQQGFSADPNQAYFEQAFHAEGIDAFMLYVKAEAKTRGTAERALGIAAQHDEVFSGV